MTFDKPISFRCDNYMFSYQNVMPHVLNMHFHKMYELLWLMNGEASYIADNKTYRLTRGDIVFTRPNELHTIVFNSPDRYMRCFIQFAPSFAGFLDPNLLSVFDHISKGNTIIPAEMAESHGLYDFFHSIGEYVTERSQFFNAAVLAQLTMLIIQINVIFASRIDNSEQHTQSDRIDKIAEYLTEHTNASLDELSSQFYINKYHLCHAFKNRYGITIKEFVNIRRIARAKQLIEEGHNITELCFLCGFNDYTTFYKTFKKLTGKTPSQFFSELAADAKI